MIGMQTQYHVIRKNVAKRMKWRTVENYLSSKLCEFTNTIMKSKKIPLKTKIRFGILLLKEKMMR